MRFRFTILFMLMLSWSSWLQAGVFEFTIDRFSLDDESSQCQLRADAIKRQLVDEGIRVIRARCSRDDLFEGFLMLSVLYEAESRIKIVSSIDYQSVACAATLYKSKEQCEEMLPSQVDLFHRETGTKVFSAFCYKDRRSIDRWGIRIDGLGESERKLYLRCTMVDGPFMASEHELEQGVRQITEAVGATLAEYGIADKFIDSFNLRFYSDKSYYLNDYDDISFDDVDFCQSEKAKLDNILLNQHLNNLLVLCTERQVPSRARLHIMGLSESYLDWSNVRIDKLDVIYGSRAECELDISDIVNSSPGVLGAICDGGQHKSQMHLIIKK